MSVHCVRARWLIPSAGSAIEGGWVSVVDGQVVAIGSGTAPQGARDLGDVALLPGLVNAHTHLELSWLDGLVPPAPSMDRWIRTMMGIRKAGPPGGDDEVNGAMRTAIRSMRAAGTVLVGDISNTLCSLPLLAEEDCDATVFHEILGFRPVDPVAQVREAHARLKGHGERSRATRLLVTVVGHAPYSTAPSLFREIVRGHDGLVPLCVHIAESNEEMEFLRSGTGPIRETLEDLGVWDDTWSPPGGHPIAYLRDLGYLQRGTLLVHGVHLTLDDLEQVRRAGAVVVTCPRSNAWVGGGTPAVGRFYAAGVDVAIGTDSLASVDSLSVFDELAALRRLAPEVAAARLLDSATRVGARVLGFEGTYGRIAPGYAARFAAARVPTHLVTSADVEEYLVSGLPAADTSLVDLTAA